MTTAPLASARHTLAVLAMASMTALAAMTLIGCARPELVAGTPDGAWVKEPMISFGSPDTRAGEHCARYGKDAVLRGSLGDGRARDRSIIGPTGTHVPILAYDCR